MALVLEILLGVAILASFFVAYMSSRTWPIYQVVLVVFIFLGSVAFFYLAARALATDKAWRTAYQQKERDFLQAEQDTRQLREGGAPGEDGQPSKGIVQLKRDLAILAQDRGGVLYDVAVDSVKDGTVQLTLKSAEHSLVPNTVLFAFNQNPISAGGKYQGEFKVVAVGEKPESIQVAPNLPLSEGQATRLANAKGPWTLYSTMPIDDLAPPKVPKVTAPPPGQEPPADQPPVDPSADPAAAPPAATPAAPAVALSTAPDGLGSPDAPANRALRDYEFLFHENYLQQSLLKDSISELTSNIDRTNAAIEEANREIGYRQTEQGLLTSDRDNFQQEQKAIAAYQQALEKRLAQLRTAARAAYSSNLKRAAELTARQLQASEEINSRTALAPSGREPAPANP